MLRTGLCYYCGELKQLPYRAFDEYFCSSKCLAAYEDELEEDDEVG